MTDKFDIPFNVIDEWEDLLKNQGICSAFYAAAEWGYNKRENKTTMPASYFSPITPPPELVKQWCHDRNKWTDFENVLSIRAARWGADQELEACCECLSDELAAYLRDRRPPNQPSLKEQALAELEATERCHPADYSTIRRALEALPDD